MLMKTRIKHIALAIAVAAAGGLSANVLAQETSSNISGKIVGPAGNPAVGTRVKIVHLPSGTSRTLRVNPTGAFTASGLRVGGPYQISVDSPEFRDTQVSDIFLTLGETYNLNMSLQADTALEEMVVTASALNAGNEGFGAIGPAATFNLDDLGSAPAINRDINDIIRMDPRIYMDESFNNAIQCAGANPRYNSLTVDGVRLNDSFGLNSNGYPTESMPFSFDAIDQVAVELAPFDVQYGGFTACNINAVTKSGTNEIRGGVFFDYTSDSLKGDEIEGVDIDNGDYSEERYGFHLGLPIIEDRLFVFTAYEMREGSSFFEYGGNAATAADVSRIREIAQNTYSYDIGDQPASMPSEDKKLLVKVDWNINDAHRASLVYNWNDGFIINQSDSFSQAKVFSSTFYERGAELTSIVGSLYSDWSDSLSTELRIGKTDLDNRQVSLDAASGFPEVQIRVGSSTVFIGPDDSRQSNDLDWDNLTLKTAANYHLGDHTITAGYEMEDLNIFNLFMQHTIGEYRFDSIDDFAAGTPSRIYYNNAAGTNNPNDVAASFSYMTHSAYLQDKLALTDTLTLLFGLRYDWYSSSDAPTYNAKFENRYGFANTETLDGRDLLQPRLGLTWDATDSLQVRAGAGLYSGGNPNVWISNNFSNDGVTQIGLVDSSGDSLFDVALSGSGRPLYDIPQHLFDTIGNTAVGDGDGSVNALDPDFEIPAEWKFALGATYIMPDETVLTADILHSRRQDSAIVRDIALRDSGADAPDGRPLYESIEGRRSEYMLTNVDGDDGESTVLSLALSREYDNGIDVTLAYAYTEATDVNPMTSSVAGSNYGNIAVYDPGNPGVQTSNYEIPHRFTWRLGYTTELFDGYETRVGLFGFANRGQPYSYTFLRSDDIFGDSSFYSNGRQLLYVPDENDPNVIYGEDFDLSAFNQFIQYESLEQYRGEIVPRNALNADWWIKMDLRVEQEFPGFMRNHRGSAFFVVRNLGNLLNDDWGVMRQGSFVGEGVVTASLNEDNQYVYESFEAPSIQTIQQNPSLWEIRVGLKYSF